MAKTNTMTKEDHRKAGKSHLTFMRQLLKEHGDDAKLELRACHMRSLLAAAAASPIKH